MGLCETQSSLGYMMNSGQPGLLGETLLQKTQSNPELSVIVHTYNLALS